ncbi:hypothetical protein [Hespellia stercorisuis]|uniref:Uncharacterized protein n=1 Tax=Hespellia stercorisuis DSM 15480 TaxID=1121950 RepID=A0A1M6RQ17_9FIRM|nr:hypothetical protein [Hespellia stercorisuis]SHK34438.1 hypothetical protein SAMN02745243_02754 [Hespellia stercorisuis DSM 15480]
MDTEKIMEICSEALGKAGYIISNYSELHERFDVTDGDSYIQIAFEEVD